jgi:hypothetical protein
MYDVRPSGKFTSRANVVFANKQRMLDFLKIKGRNFQYIGPHAAGTPRPLAIPLWRSIFKPDSEILVSKQTSKATGVVRQAVLSTGLVPETEVSKWVDGDWNVGYIVVRDAPGGCARRVEKARGSNLWSISDGAPVLTGVNMLDALAEIKHVA